MSRWRRKNLKARYGITPETFDQMAAVQGGQCAICRQEADLSVDHHHEQDTIRGLLCSSCNVGLGHFRDDPRLLYAAAVYVVRNSKGSV